MMRSGRRACFSTRTAAAASTSLIAINEVDAAAAVRVLKQARLPDRIMDTISKNYTHNFNEAWGVS